jgi:hypothetical protein
VSIFKGFSLQTALFVLLRKKYPRELAQAGLLTLWVLGRRKTGFLGQHHFHGL